MPNKPLVLKLGFDDDDVSSDTRLPNDINDIPDAGDKLVSVMSFAVFDILNPVLTFKDLIEKLGFDDEFVTKCQCLEMLLIYLMMEMN